MASVITEVSAVCVKSGRTDVFGRPLEVGTFYQLPIGYARSLVQSGHVTVSDLSVFDVDKSPYWLPFGVPISFKFDGFTTGRLVASLVAGSTATRVGLLVTVTATAHGIPSGTYDGADFFFPGCPSLAAGWFNNFQYVSANSITFTIPSSTAGADFAGESVNGGFAYVTGTRACSLILPAKTMKVGSRATISLMASGSTSASTKYVRGYIETDLVGTLSWTTTLPNIVCGMTLFCDTPSRQVTIQFSYDTKPHGSWSVTNYRVDQNLEFSVTLAVPAASEYVYLAGASLGVLR